MFRSKRSKRIRIHYLKTQNDSTVFNTADAGLSLNTALVRLVNQSDRLVGYGAHDVRGATSEQLSEIRNSVPVNVLNTIDLLKYPYQSSDLDSSKSVSPASLPFYHIILNITFIFSFPKSWKNMHFVTFVLREGQFTT